MSDVEGRWVHGSLTIFGDPDLLGNVDICRSDTGEHIATVNAMDLAAFAGGRRQARAIEGNTMMQARIDILRGALLAIERYCEGRDETWAKVIEQIIANALKNGDA